ncbi:MAG TPA: hypothetical protein VJ867_13410 [Gemmatimonadaceae bacterium]|nr:hypothetical protein [Gemmatimonadaceae bacterium]
MRIARIAATLLVAGPVLLSAQTTSSTTSARVYTSNGSVARVAPETVYVRGTVTGIVPTGTNYVITGSKSSWIVDTVYNTSSTSSMNNMDMSTTPSTGENDLEKTTNKAGKDISNATKKAGKDVSNEAKRTPKNLEKTTRKVGHGVKEAASDVKKAVTGKP